jgi:hypothetical protein
MNMSCFREEITLENPVDAGNAWRGLIKETEVRKVTVKDAAAMGFNLIDATDTMMGELNDRVVIESVTNDSIMGRHTHIIRYHTKSNSRYPRLPYYRAVFHVYLQGAGDPSSALNGERGWSKGYMSENNWFKLRHESGDVGKTAHYRVRWETDSGAKGPWSMASAEVW